MRILTGIVVLVMCFSAQARPVMTVTCNEPNGQRVDFYDRKFEEKQDGFAGVKPMFIFNDDKPSSAVVIFGPAAGVKELGLKDTGAFEAVVVVRNSEQITLVASTGTHIAQMYSLFPKKGIGYFTLHKYLPFQDGIASTATLISKCEFATR